MSKNMPWECAVVRFSAVETSLSRYCWRIQFGHRISTASGSERDLINQPLMKTRLLPLAVLIGQRHCCSWLPSLNPSRVGGHIKFSPLDRTFRINTPALSIFFYKMLGEDRIGHVL
jgi:hypothetical protein